MTGSPPLERRGVFVSADVSAGRRRERETTHPSRPPVPRTNIEKRRVCGVFLRCSAQMGGADGGHTPAVCARFQFAKSACLPYNRYGNMPIGAQFRPPTPASYNLTIVGVCPPAHDFGLLARFGNALRGGNVRMCEFQRWLLRHNTFVIVRIRSSVRNFGVRTRLRIP